MCGSQEIKETKPTPSKNAHPLQEFGWDLEPMRLVWKSVCVYLCRWHPSLLKTGIVRDALEKNSSVARCSAILR